MVVVVFLQRGVLYVKVQGLAIVDDVDEPVALQLLQPILDGG